MTTRMSRTMPPPDEIREDQVHSVHCSACGLELRPKVPIGVRGDFFHPECFGFDAEAYERQMLDTDILGETVLSSSP